MKNILMTLLIVLAFNACGGGGSGDDTTDKSSSDSSSQKMADESLRGEWMYIHNGTKVYIDENFKDPITKVDNTLIKVEKNGVIYHLMRSGIDTTVVSGNLHANTSAQLGSALQKGPSRGIGNIGNINVVLSHITDKYNRKKETLSGTGKFEFDDVKSGKYTLEATADNNLTVTTDVDIYGEEISLGGFTLVNNDGYNFKTEFVIDNSDSGYFYGSLKTYTGKLKIKNIGKVRGTGLNYTFSTDSTYVKEYTNEIVLGTVDVNKTIDIPFTISFGILDKATVTIPLNIIIKDVHNNEWVDTVFFHVYQTPMNVNIATKEANVKGYIIAPGHELTPINTSNANILVPYRAGKKYFLVLSNPNVNSETPYSIGIDTDTLSFDTFQDTSAHEPNDKESQAFTIRPNESIVSYLHAGDIDYYVIDMSSNVDVGRYSPPQMPFR